MYNQVVNNSNTKFDTGINSKVDPLGIMNNKLFYTNLNVNNIGMTLLAVLLVLYSAFIAHKLPPHLEKNLNKSYIILVALVLIIYLTTKKAALGLLVALAILITIQSHVRLYNPLQYNNQIIPTTANNSREISLSPKRSQLIQECINKSQFHNEQASTAEAIGDTKQAEAEKYKVWQKNLKIEYAIKSKNHLIKAKIAEEAGYFDLVTEHMNYAKNFNMKLITLIKEEQLHEHAQAALTEGRIDKAEKLYNYAKIEADKLQLLLEIDDHIEKASRAQNNGQDNESKIHLAKAMELNKIYSDYKSNEEEIYALIENNNTLPDTVKNEQLPVEQNESQILGYDHLDYAVY